MLSDWKLRIYVIGWKLLSIHSYLEKGEKKVLSLGNIKPHTFK